MLKIVLLILVLTPLTLLAQQTKVSGVVKDAVTEEPLPFVKVQFKDSKIGVLTDSVGFYSIETYYATDSLRFTLTGYITQRFSVKRDKEQTIDVELSMTVSEIEELTVLPPDELPSVTLHKKIINNKPINDREKLSAYEYELYNKIQFDLNNIGDKFKEKGIVKRMDLILDYLDSTENGKNYLPVIFTEGLSDFYYTNNPKRKKEVLKATRVVGIDNIQLDQFLGEMYMDINIYDNNINIVNRSFISPISNFARNYYQFLIVDSSFINNLWCYKMTFKPKRQGDMTFEGEMWVHDTTYAIKSIKGTIAPWANINYLQDLYFEQNFSMVEKEVWMMVNETILADFKLTKKTSLYGIYARKYSSRKNFVINQAHPDAFYKSNNTVEIADSAHQRDEAYWTAHRHVPLSFQQTGIGEMIDSLKTIPFFKRLQGVTYMLTTGYYPYGYFDFGMIYNMFSYNQVEKFRFGVAIRTSNKFSRRLEIGGKVYYGFGDERFKYGGSIRYNVSPQKRGMLSAFYNYDIEQIGASTKASQVGSTFGTLFRTGPLDKLTFVEKAGINFEKDVHKDIVLFTAFEWKEYTPLGLANYLRMNENTGFYDTINSIRTSEVTFRFRWAKDEEFVGGAFDRVSIKSRFPIISFQTILGIKGALGSDYQYQKYELALDHRVTAGVLGYIRYGASVGYINGSAAYPFLKVHEGNQSYFLYKTTFNMLNFFEFISDKYADAYIENHWGGLFLDYIPGIKKLKWRFVSSARATWGMIDSRHEKEMILPPFTKQFGNTPYIEVSLGLENIFKLLRFDVFYRVTHQIPGVSPFGFRARWEIFL